MFADSGLSDAEISALFPIWSRSASSPRFPPAPLADRFSRRAALAAGGPVAGGWLRDLVGPARLCGVRGRFRAVGPGGALASGRPGSPASTTVWRCWARSAAYPRLLGRITAAGLLAQIPAAVLATVLFALGGYLLVGWVSVLCCLTTAGLALLLRDVRPSDPVEPDQSDRTTNSTHSRNPESRYRRAISSPAVRGLVLAAGVLGGPGRPGGVLHPAGPGLGSPHRLGATRRVGHPSPRRGRDLADQPPDDRGPRHRTPNAGGGTGRRRACYWPRRSGCPRRSGWSGSPCSTRCTASCWLLSAADCRTPSMGRPGPPSLGGGAAQ